MKTITRLLSLVTFISLALPGAALAQMSSTNYSVKNPSLTNQPSVSASSTNYRNNYEAGGLYMYGNPAATTSTSDSGRRSSTGGTRTADESIEPMLTSTIVIGPAKTEVGALTTVVVSVEDGAEDDDVEVFVDGVQLTSTAVRRLNTSIWSASFTPVEERQYVLTARVNGVMVSRDSDGVSDGRLYIAVVARSAAGDQTDQTDQTAESGRIDEILFENESVNEGSGKRENRLPFRYGVTQGCHTAFTWQKGSPLSITRTTATDETVIATLSGAMPWFVDETKLTGTTTYFLADRSGRTGEVVLGADALEQCDALYDELVTVDIDNDGNDEQFIAGIFQDIDGSSQPIARTASGGLFIDTNNDGNPDVFWQPKSDPTEEIVAGISDVIAAVDRYFIVDETLSIEQNYQRTTTPGYTVQLESSELGRARLSPVTPRINALRPEIDDEPTAPANTEIVSTISRPLIGIGFGAGLLNLLFLYFTTPFSIKNIGQLIYLLFNIMFGAVTVTKRRRPWGTVYDSSSKAPLDPAIVELFDQHGQSVKQAITDLDGRYGFLVPAGEYTMKVRKSNYRFPSTHRPVGERDVIYSNLYYGGPTTISETVNHDVPMDPENFDWNQYEKMRTKQTTFFHKFDPLIARFSDWAFFFGAGAMVWQFYLMQTWFTGLLLAIYLLLLMYRIYKGKPPLYGVVRHKGTLLPYAVIRVMQGGSKVTEKVADSSGRYIAILPVGTYTLQVLLRHEDDTLEKLKEYTMTVKQGYVNRPLNT